MVQTVQKPLEMPQLHFIDKFVGIPVLRYRRLEDDVVSTVIVHPQSGRCPCCAGRAGSTGSGREEDSRDPKFADRQESR